MIKLFPSVLSADYKNLEKSLLQFRDNPVDAFHVDIMDGHFVPNLTFGPWICDTIGEITPTPVEVHLMLDNPENFIDEFSQPNVKGIMVHSEPAFFTYNLIQRIKNNGKRAGITINPGTSVSTIEDILRDLDIVLIMTVNPGFGGQKFIELCLDKIEKLYQIKQEKGYCFDIYVDGGINQDTISRVVSAGANGLVAGNSIFKNPNPPNHYNDLLNIAKGVEK